MFFSLELSSLQKSRQGNGHHKMVEILPQRGTLEFYCREPCERLGPIDLTLRR